MNSKIRLVTLKSSNPFLVTLAKIAHFLLAVVIDGNNFVCDSYLQCPNLNPCFGGDYNVYYEYLRNILHSLKRCKVEPIFVFDGGLDKGNRKYRQRMSVIYTYYFLKK